MGYFGTKLCALTENKWGYICLQESSSSFIAMFFSGWKKIKAFLYESTFPNCPLVTAFVFFSFPAWDNNVPSSKTCRGQYIFFVLSSSEGSGNAQTANIGKNRIQPIRSPPQ